MARISILLVIFLGTTHAVVFDKCSIARELLRHGFSRSELADWVCLIQHESSYNTKAINKDNSDRSWDWGLFQINDKWWCQGNYPGKSSNMCQVDCKEFLKDNIAASARCAKMIKNQQGFSAWVAWTKYCKNSNFNLNDCDLGCGSRNEF